MPDTRRFSHSLIDTMTECARKAYFRYIEKLEDPKTPALLKGSACDEAWNGALEAKLEGGTIARDDLLALTEERYRANVSEAGGLSSINWQDSGDRKDLARKHLAQALQMAGAWHDELYPLIQPTAVQVRLERTLPSGRTFIGFLDWEGVYDERLEAIGDNKTGSKSMADYEAEKALQPTAYAFLKGHATDFVFARSILLPKSGTKTQAVHTCRSVEDADWYGQMVEEVEAQWVAGNFPPNPKSNLCGPKFCSFYERCMPHRTTHTSANLETKEG